MDSSGERDYKILNQEEIKIHMESDISTIRNVLSIERGSSCSLLCSYGWRVETVKEEWIKDERRVRQAAGLLEVVPPTRSRNTKKLGLGMYDDENSICSICFQKTLKENMFAACGKHLYCVECWKSYISTSIANDGLGCLELYCPGRSCKVVVDADMIDKLASDNDKLRYYNYLIQSYVEESSERKWCPAPGCGCVVQSNNGGKSLNDVVCECSFRFCWSCLEEPHQPVNCEIVRKWVQSNRHESDKWILAYTQPCPECKRPIQKVGGCNHVICKYPCRYSFSWDSSIITKIVSKASRRETSRHIHYYDRWASNDKLHDIALADLDFAKRNNIGKLMIEAWEQIVECRRVLKWTFAYAYYIPEKECHKTRFLEELKRVAASAVERLHDCAKLHMKVYIQANDLNDVPSNLANLTQVTKFHFDNLVKALHNGLSEAGTHDANTDNKGDDDDRDGWLSTKLLFFPITMLLVFKIFR